VIRVCADKNLRTKGYQFLDEPDNATRGGLAAIAFLADMGKSTPEVLPMTDQPGERCL